jgi:hypothetical protein
MFRTELDIAGIVVPGFQELALLMNELRSLVSLTPGDFATVRRRYRLSGLEGGANGLLQMLSEECASRNAPTRRAVGFLAGMEQQ